MRTNNLRTPIMTPAFHGFPVKVAFAAFLFVCALQASFAQTCPDPVTADFRVDTLANNATGDLFEGSSVNGGESGNWYGVVQMAVAPGGKVFVAKMASGQVRVYDPASGLKAATTLAGRVPTHYDNEDGLLGIALDPNFATTKWLYVFVTDSAYATTPANADTGKAHSLWRYTWDSTAAAGQQLKNPKRILRVQRMIDNNAYHAAGGIDIAADGTMVIGTGDDTSPHSNLCNGNNYAPLLWNDRGCDAQKSAANTASLRGKILRIKPIAFPDTETPTPGLGTTYNVPPGNLWEVINQPAFNPNWNSAVDNISKVRKEIYTMGHRNPYHPRIDSKSGWVFTGEVGLDATAPSTTRGPEGREEFNLATQPGFYGHPYCEAKNIPWKKFTSPGTTWDTASYNCAAIQNLSPNNYGITNLPPAREAILNYSQVSNNGDDSYRMGFNTEETAIGGPMYRYDPALVSAVKFPPQYEGKIFFFDWSNTNKASFRIISLNPNGTLDSGTTAVKASPLTTLSALPNGSYIDMRFGADGAMYLLRNSTSGSSYLGFNQAALFRIRYVGAIDNACYAPFVATVGPVALATPGKAIQRAVAPSIAVINGMVTLPVGYRTVTLYDLTGRKVWGYTRADADHAQTVRIESGLASGILQSRMTP